MVDHLISVFHKFLETIKQFIFFKEILEFNASGTQHLNFLLLGSYVKILLGHDLFDSENFLRVILIFEFNY